MAGACGGRHGSHAPVGRQPVAASRARDAVRLAGSERAVPRAPPRRLPLGRRTVFPADRLAHALRAGLGCRAAERPAAGGGGSRAPKGGAVDLPARLRRSRPRREGANGFAADPFVRVALQPKGRLASHSCAQAGGAVRGGAAAEPLLGGGIQLLALSAVEGGAVRPAPSAAFLRRGAAAAGAHVDARVASLCAHQQCRVSPLEPRQPRNVRRKGSPGPGHQASLAAEGEGAAHRARPSADRRRVRFGRRGLGGVWSPLRRRLRGGRD
mmetsp:Transcript_8399/g.15185  ORF Transcript_8399/g.15185 Transcript_8399/m.15185 type:complete len:268 (+) Transcript_8399:970-1773(+)